MVVLADEDTSTSWAQTIQRYDASRKTLEWAPNEFKPVTKIGNGERKAMERELDPVVMQFRDPDREAARTQRKTEEMNGTLSRYSGIVAGRRNIINGYGGPPKTPPVQRMEQIRDNHIISNVATAAYKHLPILYDEAFTEANRQPRRREPKSTGDGRDMDIISNKYFKDDKERKEKEYIELRQTCHDRYWKGRDMHPVLQTYYHDDKEATYQAQRETLSRIHGGAKMRRLPLSIRYSEGASYNIINHEVGDDPEKLKTAMTMQIRSQNRQKRASIESDMRARGQELHDKHDSRKLDRVSYRRYQDQLERGYDPLKSHVHAPMAGAVPRPARPLTSWEKLGGSDSGREADALPRAPASARLAPSNRTALSAEPTTPSGGPVPSLDLSRTDFGKNVTYSEPGNNGSSGVVKMSVRTGGRL